MAKSYIVRDPFGKLPDETDTAKAKNGYEQMLGDIDKILTDYENKKPQGIVPPEIAAPNLAEKEYDAPTDEQLRDRAESELTDGYLTGVADIEADVKEKGESLSTAKDQLKAQTDEYLKEVDELYAGAKRATENDTLKRGLSRSSIAVIQLGNLDAEAADKKTSVVYDSSQKLLALDGAIAGLENEKAAALRDYDIKHAAKLEQKLSALKDERAQRQDEVTEYNNSIRKQLAEFELKKQEFNQDYRDKEYDIYDKSKEYLAQERNRLEAEKSTKIYDSVKVFLGQFTPATARKTFASNDYYKKVLSASDYNKLRNELEAAYAASK